MRSVKITKCNRQKKKRGVFIIRGQEVIQETPKELWYLFNHISDLFLPPDVTAVLSSEEFKSA